jgi:hypothetical protein
MIRMPAFMIPVDRTGETLSGIPLGHAGDPGRTPGDEQTPDRSIMDRGAPTECVFCAASTAQGESFP